MQQDARLSTALPGHPKTKKLVRRLGPGAGWSLVCLILWTRANRADGSLAGMSAEDIELAAEWTGENDAFVRELVDIRFLDDDGEGGYRLHDWAEHQPWAAGSDMRSLKSRWLAVKRHHGIREADRQVPEYARIRAETSQNDAGSTKKDAGSNAQGMQPASSSNAETGKTDAPSPSPSPSPIPSPSPKEKIKSGRPATAERTLSGWIENLPEGEDAVAGDDPVLDYAQKVGLPEEFVVLAWEWMLRQYGRGGPRQSKRYRDWRQVLRNAVEGNWGKLWFTDPDGGYGLTTVGLQLQRLLRDAA